MSYSKQILAGVAAGVAVGLFLGDLAGSLKVAADAYLKLLQMTVLPYVVVSIIIGLGSLSLAQAKTLALRGGAVLVLLWALALAVVFVFPLMLPPQQTASFFSTTLLAPREPFDFVGLYIPSNPFNALANNVVPAVVLFSAFLGVSLIAVPDKQPLLDVFAVAEKAMARVMKLVARLMPLGLFFITATAAGTHQRGGAAAAPGVSALLHRRLAAAEPLGPAGSRLGADAHSVPRGARPDA